MDDVEKKMLELVDEICQQEIILLDIVDKQEALAIEIDNARQQLKLDVSLEKHAVTEKPLFSNESMREAEVTKRLSSDSSFNAKVTELGELKHKRAMAEIQLRFLNNSFRARIAVMQGRVAK